MRGHLNAARLNKSASISLHFVVTGKPFLDVFHYFGRVLISRFDDAIVHPFSFAPSADDSCLPKISQVPGDFRLRSLQHLDEVTHANLVVAHQIK